MIVLFITLLISQSDIWMTLIVLEQKHLENIKQNSAKLKCGLVIGTKWIRQFYTVSMPTPW